MKKSIIFLFIFLLSLVDIHSTDWPQLGRDPARSNYTPDTPPLTNLQVRWLWKPSNGARIGAHVQPVISQGILVMGTSDGNVYGINIGTGIAQRERWVFKTGGPIIHTAAIDNNKVFVGSADSKLYAIDLFSGTTVWIYQGESGFYTAPLVVNNRVYACEVDGKINCLNQADGSVIWSTATNIPILCCPCYGDNKIFVGTHDMYARAFNADTGVEVWKTRLYGEGFNLYWPVYSNNTVVFRTRRMYADGPDVIVDWTINILTKSQYCDDSDDDYTGTQQEIRDYLIQHPDEKTFWVLNSADGTERFTAPVALVARHQDCPLPPVLDGNGRFHAVIRVRSSAFYGFSFASGYNTCDGTWGSIVPDFARLNLSTGLFERLAPFHTWNTWNGWRMCCDDMSIFTIAGNYFIGIHEPRQLSIANMSSFTDYHPNLSWDTGGDIDNSGIGYNPVVISNGVIYNHNHLGWGSVAAIW